MKHMRKKAFWILAIICISLGAFISCGDGFSFSSELKVAPSGNGNNRGVTLSIIVRADAVGKFYTQGEPLPDPPLTYTFDPDPLPDGVSLTGELARDAGELAGTYVIRQGTLELTGPNADKYTLQYVGNRFSIYGY